MRRFIDVNKFMIKSFYQRPEGIRINTLKILKKENDELQIYVDNGKNVKGFDKYAQIRIDRQQQEKLRDYLNEVLK